MNFNQFINTATALGSNGTYYIAKIIPSTAATKAKVVKACDRKYVICIYL